MKSPKTLKQLASFFENYTEMSLILFGVVAVLLVIVFPLRLDIKLLLGGFGFYLVAAGLAAKFISKDG
jgi:hypothetical protein